MVEVDKWLKEEWKNMGLLVKISKERVWGCNKTEHIAVALAWVWAENVFLGMRHLGQKTLLFLRFPQIPDALAAHLWSGNSHLGGKIDWAVFCPCLPSEALGFSVLRLSPYAEHCVLEKVPLRRQACVTKLMLWLLKRMKYWFVYIFTMTWNCDMILPESKTQACISSL